MPIDLIFDLQNTLVSHRLRVCIFCFERPSYGVLHRHEVDGLWRFYFCIRCVNLPSQHYSPRVCKGK